MTKDQLLQNVSEEQIIRMYVPEFSPTAGKNYKSPFAGKDDHPSLSFYREGNHWKFKSHNTGHQGDVFQFVADLKHIDCKQSFTEVVEVIAKDFGLNGYAKPQGKKQSVTISYEKAPTVEMLQYFERFGIDLETLMRFDVRQVKFHHFVSEQGKTCKFDYRKLQRLAICYIVHDRIKLYFPAIEGRQEKAFGYKDQTTADIFGLRQIAESHHEKLFIAAGEKDCLALNAAGFPAVSLQSENTIPTAAQVKALNILADDIFIVYDNDEPGKKAAAKLASVTNWKIYPLPRHKDVAEFMEKEGQQAFRLAFSNWLATPPPVPPVNPPAASADDDEQEVFTIFHLAEKYLNKRYELRFNTIKLELEGKRKGEEKWEPVNENDLFVEMNKAGVKIGMDKLIALLKSCYIPRFNPIKQYFESLPPWDGETDHISQLASHLHTHDPEELQLQFGKWLVRCVRCALEEGYYNKQAFILVHAQQNSGKTTFCRFVCPPALKDYMAENISDDKDSRIAVAKNFLINLDELSSLAKHEINSLKALFSKDIINERLPYDRKNSIIHRVANFIGSTNMAEFLTDETGSVRWLCFEIRKIDWSYKDTIDINAVWAQAYALYKEGLPCEMTREEIERNEKRNSKYQLLSAEAEIIPNYLQPATEDTQGAAFLSATDILVYIQTFAPSLRLNKISIGRAMPLCGFHRTKDPATDRYGYWAVRLK